MSSRAPEQQRRAERIEELLHRIGDIPDPSMRAQVEELIQSLLDLFGDGLAHILELTEQSPAGDELLAAFSGDDLVGSLLLLYGLHPDDVETRVARAVAGVRGHVEKHGSSVELMGVVGGVAHVLLNGSCSGCSSSSAALQPMIEQAIYAAAPDLEGVRIEDASARPQRLITLTPARRKSAEPLPVAQGGNRP